MNQEALPLLQIKGLVKTYGKAPALNGVSLSVGKGDAVVILGPSGCGKSTLLRCINGLERIQSGEIILNGENISNPGARWDLVRQRVGMVFQSYDLFPHMSVLDNVLLGPLKVQKRDKAEARRQAEGLLARVGLLDRKKDYPRQLSGGQKQRVAIVRALCMNPDLMLFDEVTAALDPEMVREVLDVIAGLAEQGMTMLIVTHEMDFAKAIADKAVFIVDGAVEEESDGEVFFRNPRTERARRFLNSFQYESRRPRRKTGAAPSGLTPVPVTRATMG
ncbi:MAG: amino acid ABC transporter ATP-binding protein [Clostridiales Family XIII bacterium]|jgi:polar amino acid transport system ATP-binding protein|nr:amino acid ABC transporter ATP-binding protein [Clostridiales Family XIII bacterium]